MAGSSIRCAYYQVLPRLPMVPRAMSVPLVVVSEQEADEVGDRDEDAAADVHGGTSPARILSRSVRSETRRSAAASSMVRTALPARPSEMIHPSLLDGDGSASWVPVGGALR